MNATALLNAIADATQSTDRNVCINIALAMLVKSGAPMDRAFDALFGEGAYLKMAGNMYQTLRGE